MAALSGTNARHGERLKLAPRYRDIEARHGGEAADVCSLYAKNIADRMLKGKSWRHTVGVPRKRKC
jgi:hypothetical protein